MGGDLGAVARGQAGDVDLADRGVLGGRGGGPIEGQERVPVDQHQRRGDIARAQAGEVPPRVGRALRALKKQVGEDEPKVATRKSSEMVLQVINPIMTETLGGSADLTGSNNTLTPDLGVHEPGNRKGRYIYYGVREHGMAASSPMAVHFSVSPTTHALPCGFRR